MSESFRGSVGRRVVSRASAQELGAVGRLLTTVDCQRVAAVIIGRGKKAQLVDWDQLTGFGADAVMVADEGAVRAASDDREQRAAQGKLELLGARVLSDAGNELGTVDDVVFDPVSGAVEALILADHQIAADAVLSAGSYAVVVAASHDPA